MAQHFSATVTLTSDATTIAPGFRPTYMRIEASTANTAFFNFSSTVIATTASSLGFALASGAAPIVFDRPGPVSNNGMSSQFTAISSSGGSTVVKVLAVRI